MEHVQKIDTALVTVLKNQAWPAEFNTDLILPGESAADKSGQCLLCFVEDADQEDPQFTGDRWNLIRLELRTPSLKDQSTSITRHKSAAQVLETIALDSTLKDQLTAAVSDFTAIGILDRLPIRDQNQNYWMSGYSFRLYSCSSNIT